MRGSWGGVCKEGLLAFWCGRMPTPKNGCPFGLALKREHAQHPGASFCMAGTAGMWGSFFGMGNILYSRKGAGDWAKKRAHRGGVQDFATFSVLRKKETFVPKNVFFFFQKRARFRGAPPSR